MSSSDARAAERACIRPRPASRDDNAGRFVKRSPVTVCDRASTAPGKTVQAAHPPRRSACLGRNTARPGMRATAQSRLQAPNEPRDAGGRRQDTFFHDFKDSSFPRLREGPAVRTPGTEPECTRTPGFEGERSTRFGEPVPAVTGLRPPGTERAKAPLRRRSAEPTNGFMQSEFALLTNAVIMSPTSGTAKEWEPGYSCSRQKRHDCRDPRYRPAPGNAGFKEAERRARAAPLASAPKKPASRFANTAGGVAEHRTGATGDGIPTTGVFPRLRLHRPASSTDIGIPWRPRRTQQPGRKARRRRRPSTGGPSAPRSTAEGGRSPAKEGTGDPSRAGRPGAP